MRKLGPKLACLEREHAHIIVQNVAKRNAVAALKHHIRHQVLSQARAGPDPKRGNHAVAKALAAEAALPAEDELQKLLLSVAKQPLQLHKALGEIAVLERLLVGQHPGVKRTPPLWTQLRPDGLGG